MSFSGSLTTERGPSVFAMFDIQVSESIVFRYTDADEAVFFNGFEYTPEPIRYSELVSDGTLKKTAVTLESRFSLPPAKFFRVDPPSFISTLKIYEGNFSDYDRDYRQVWSGRIINCKFEGGLAKFTCEPASTSLSRPGLRRNYQRPCPHAVYGPLCKANRVEESVSWVSGSEDEWVLSLPAAFISPESYDGGLVSWVDSSGNRRFQTILRSILDGGSLRVRVNRSLRVGEVPNSISVVKGCDHTEEACSIWHNNIVNYGGCPFIPLDTPINKFSTFY